MEKTNESQHQFLGMDVKLILFDGFRKYGLLTSTDNLFYYLKFNDGSIVGINKTTVKQISLNKKNGGSE